MAAHANMHRIYCENQARQFLAISFLVLQHWPHFSARKLGLFDESEALEVHARHVTGLVIRINRLLACKLRVKKLCVLNPLIDDSLLAKRKQHQHSTARELFAQEAK
jgi:hypothetical protein